MPPQHQRLVRKAIETLESRVLLSSWYVAASGGLNSNPGTLAQPFATIQAAANVAQPGDTVFIEGGVYHETVTPVNSGTAGEPITYEPYDGQQVTIDGADPVTGWTLDSGSIYEAPQSWDLGDGNNQVFANGQMLTEAQWPVSTNTSLDPMDVTTATITSTNAAAATQDTQTSATIFNSSLSQAAGFWVGATIHISPGQQWIWQTGTVTASSPGSITYSYTQLTSYEVPKAGNPFYLTGIASQLDAPGEFYHNAATNTLFVWTPSGSAPTDIESKARQYAFNLSGLSFINIQGLQIHAASINTSASSSNIDLSNLTISYVSQQMDNAYPWGAKYVAGTTGLLINGTNSVLSNLTITDSSGNGVYLGGSNNTVEDCTISQVDYAAGDEAAVNVRGTGEIVSHNLIYDTGRSAVTFYFSPQTQIFNNIIYDVGLRTSDAGGVYAWNTDGEGSEVAYNIIYNVYGGGYGNSGILLDNNCESIVVDHNVVYDADTALKMNGVSTDDDVYNNTLLAATNPPTFPNTLINAPAALTEGATPSMPGCNIINNIMIGPVNYAAGAMQSNNLTSESSADFVNAPGGNFQLEAGSGAINAGVVVAPYTNGYAGSAPDIGAYEYGVAAFQAGPSQSPQIVATPPSDQTATQGTAVSIQLGSFTATGTTPPFSVTVNWGDGSADSVYPVSAAGSIPAAVHTFASVGNFSPTVTVSDSAGNNSNTTTFTVTSGAAAAVPTQLAFGQQPTAAAVGATLTPAITVMVEDAAGNTFTAGDPAFADVTLSIASGPAGALLGGTLTVPVQNGIAAFSDLSLTVPGTYTLMAADGSLAAAVSGSFTISAAVLATNTTLTASSSTPLQNQLVTLTAAVAPAGQSGPVPTGQVNFYDNEVLLGSSSVESDGQAQFATTALSPGAHSITATYEGDSTEILSVSTPLALTVTAPPADAPTLVSTLSSAGLPPAILEGAKFKSLLPVTIANKGGGISNGVLTIVVYASPEPSLGLGAVPILSVMHTARLNIGASKTFSVRPGPLPTTLANGTYYLVAQVMDPAGYTNAAVAGSPIQVAAPFVSLSAAAGAVTPATLAVGKTGTIAITITNNGNVPATGTMTIDLGLSAEGTALDLSVLTTTRNMTIKPNSTAVIRLHFKRTATQPAGMYFPTVSISQNGQEASATGMTVLTLS